MDELERLKEKRRELRRKERELMKQTRMFNSQRQYMGQSPQSLQKQIQSTMPAYMVPSNVGGVQEVSWFFYETVNFNFGVVAVLNNTIRQTQSFQVTQEACLVLSAVSYAPVNAASMGLPMQITFRDRQSSRQFNDNPIPLPSIAKKGNWTILPTGMLILPNAFFDVEMTTFATAQPVAANVSYTMTFFGYRIRIQDQEKILSTVFDI